MLADKESEVIEYYRRVWLERVVDLGHNGISRAFHYGYSPNPEAPLSTQEAKLATNRLVVDQLDLETKKSHLVGDFGCGVGGTALYITDVLPNIHVVAVNMDQSQLDLLTGSTKFAPKRISVLQADFTQLPLKDDSLDGAYAIESSCHAVDKAAFYKGAMRSLRPGGKLVVLDYFYNRRPTDVEEQAMLYKSHTGWAVPSWHPAPSIALPAEHSFRDITKNMMPDIDRSFQRAVEAIQTTTDPVWKGHFEAIIALRRCMDLELVQYGLLVVTKS